MSDPLLADDPARPLLDRRQNGAALAHPAPAGHDDGVAWDRVLGPPTAGRERELPLGVGVLALEHSVSFRPGRPGSNLTGEVSLPRPEAGRDGAGDDQAEHDEADSEPA